MSISDHAFDAGGAMPSASTRPTSGAAAPSVRVWDLFVRLFHWSLVGLFALAFATGDEIEWLHIAAGYAIAALISLRVVWGFVGAKHARFRDFVRSPAAVLAYVGDAVRRRAPRYLGHNPAGGAMVLALLAMLAGVALTGFMMTTDTFWGLEWVEDLHEALAYATLALIVLHVAGVVVTSFEHGENLVRSMITGRKRSR